MASVARTKIAQTWPRFIGPDPACQGLDQLATEFGLSNDEIAQRVGKSRSTIANLRGLLRLPDAVLNQVGPGEGQIPQGVARTLSQVAKFKGAAKDIEQIGARLVKDDLTGFDAEDMIGDLVCKHALAMTADWDLKWLTTPVAVGEIEARDCFGCPAFVKLNGDRYCAVTRPCSLRSATARSNISS